TDAWRLVEGGDVERVDVKKLAVGDRIVIDSGGRVAADGIILRGSASLDEKALTGESLPHDKHEGDRVLAATVVVDGQIVVEIERAGGDTTAAKIVQILEGAGSKPMTLQRETEKIADRLVLPTFALAGGAAFLTSQITRATSVLITDFGTGIRIAVPTSALAAMTMAARRGVLVKGGQFLERMSKVDTIVFDKTGTLTGGCPEVFDVHAFGSHSAREAIALAASAEARQHHPIADALRRHALKLEVDVVEAELGSESYTIGRGLTAVVGGRCVMVGSARWMDEKRVLLHDARAVLAQHDEVAASSIVVAVDGELAAIVGYADAPRTESKAVVSALKQGGRRTVVLLSGDARGPVESVGRAVGVDRAIGELMPDEKARIVKELQAEGKVVAMIGDGINDAPALAVADVGISLEGGTDVALETADVVLLEGGLAKLPLAFEVADQAMAHVRRGLGIVIAPNAAAIALGALGLITPGVAAAINNGSTVVAALAALTPLLKRDKR
ncbi:MAG: heavy metal translocating P-type ATPase, partial [Polyangiaceae bacterium]